MFLRQCSSSIGTCTCSMRLLFGWQLLQQPVHKLLTEAELPGMRLPFRPELEGVDDAHVEQPPRQTRPAALRFAPRWRRGVMPAAGGLRERREESRSSQRVGNGVIAVRGRSQGGGARMGPSDERRRLHSGRGCCGGRGSVIRRPSCPCIRCCSDGP